jgi:hypothetical protein
VGQVDCEKVLRTYSPAHHRSRFGDISSTMKRLIVATIIAIATAAALTLSLVFWSAFRLARAMFRLAMKIGPPASHG